MFEAQDIQSRRDVAVKVLPPSFIQCSRAVTTRSRLEDIILVTFLHYFPLLLSIPFIDMITGCLHLENYKLIEFSSRN